MFWATYDVIAKMNGIVDCATTFSHEVISVLSYVSDDVKLATYHEIHNFAILIHDLKYPSHVGKFEYPNYASLYHLLPLLVLYLLSLDYRLVVLEFFL